MHVNRALHLKTPAFASLLLTNISVNDSFKSVYSPDIIFSAKVHMILKAVYVKDYSLVFQKFVTA